MTPEPIKWRGITLKWANGGWIWHRPDTETAGEDWTADILLREDGEANIRGHRGYGGSHIEALEHAYARFLQEQERRARLLAALGETGRVAETDVGT